MMRFGIPAYRLPRDVLTPRSPGSRPWACVFDRHRVMDLVAEREGGFDAVFVAVGAICQAGRHPQPATPAGSSTP